MANLISIIALLLFIINGFICDTFTSTVDEWWTLRLNLYSVIFGLLFYLTTLTQTKISKFICTLGIGFTTSDIIDRVFFNCNNFSWNDIIMIALTLLITYHKFYVGRGSKIIK